MDAQIQVSSEDFEVNSAQRNTSSSDQSDDSENMIQFSKQKKKSDKRKNKQNLPNIKRAIQKRDKKMTNKQLQYIEMTTNQQHINLKKKSSLSNQFAEVFEDNLLANPKQKNKNEQVFQVQQKFEHKIQVKNQQNYQELENDKKSQQEQLEANNIQQIAVNKVNNVQQNNLPNYLNNKGQFQYLRMALSKDNKQQPLLFKRFLNFLQMTQEEYDHIKQSFPEIPSEFLPQVILEQRQINKAFQNNQNQQQQQQQQQQQINQVLQNQFHQQQQQQNNQFLLNQQYQQQQNIQFFQNQQPKQNQAQQYQEQEEQNFIEIEFKFNPELSDGNLECAICAQTYLNGEKLAILLCIHRFHLNCFTSWMQKSPLCPICHHG